MKPAPAPPPTAHPRAYDLTAVASGRWQAPTFSGPLLRSALGAACASNECGPACHGPDHAAGCRFEEAFHGQGGGPAPFRFDGSGLDGRELTRGEPWRARLVVFREGVADRLLDAWKLALDRGLGRERAHHTLIDVREVSGDPVEAGPCDVRLVAPTLMMRDGRAIASPTLLDLLHGIRLRARALSLRVDLPRFEDTLQVVHQRRQRSPVPWEGGSLPAVTASWRVTATPAQAAWLSLGTLTGVGKHTSYGLGAMRVEAVR